MIPDQKFFAARLVGRCAQDELADFDKVYVRDLVLAARVGVWEHEKDQAQKVRFSVELAVRRPTTPVNALKDVISYDYIIDSIKTALSEGHILLVEVLAEKIAEYCLKDPRAMQARVAVEKIERIEGAALGCEIVRRKPEFDRY